MEHKEKDFSLSWFFKWFVDNKAITVFLVALLMGLNILVLSKISLEQRSCCPSLFLGSSIIC